LSQALTPIITITKDRKVILETEVETQGIDFIIEAYLIDVI
jgi:hypothetical protein